MDNKVTSTGLRYYFIYFISFRCKRKKMNIVVLLQEHLSRVHVFNKTKYKIAKDTWLFGNIYINIIYMIKNFFDFKLLMSPDTLVQWIVSCVNCAVSLWTGLLTGVYPGWRIGRWSLYLYRHSIRIFKIEWASQLDFS